MIFYFYPIVQQLQRSNNNKVNIIYRCAFLQKLQVFLCKHQLCLQKHEPGAQTQWICFISRSSFLREPAAWEQFKTIYSIQSCSSHSYVCSHRWKNEWDSEHGQILESESGDNSKSSKIKKIKKTSQWCETDKNPPGDETDFIHYFSLKNGRSIVVYT